MLNLHDNSLHSKNIKKIKSPLNCSHTKFVCVSNMLISKNYYTNSLCTLINNPINKYNLINRPINFGNIRFYSKNKINFIDSATTLVQIKESEIIELENYLKNLKLVTDSSNITTLLDCQNFSLKEERLEFRTKLSKVSGIYMLKCKLDSRLFYIGQAVDLSIRLASHFSSTKLESNKLANTIKLIGWNKF